ncbi:hypothetical protein HK096_009331, partial [Nowakowskiella sp. JEL0078]
SLLEKVWNQWLKFMLVQKRNLQFQLCQVQLFPRQLKRECKTSTNNDKFILQIKK